MLSLTVGDAGAIMADQPVPEKAATKVEGKNKEPQKFLYLQLQQDRVSLLKDSVCLWFHDNIFSQGII